MTQRADVRGKTLQWWLARLSEAAVQAAVLP